MADTFDSEQEQIDAIKTWWKDNGRVITIGLVLGLGGVFGWSTWQSHAIDQAESASMIYEEMINWASVRNYSRSNELADNLMRDYPDSGYAAFGGLVRASNAFAENHPDEARGYLQWVIENARRVEVKNLARLRVARLAADKQEYTAALSVLDEATNPGHYQGAYEEVRGDILVAQNDIQAGAQHYANALDEDRISEAGRRRIQMKLNDLGLTAGK